MNQIITKLFLGGLCITFLFSGCSKKKDDVLNTTSPSITSAPSVSFNFSDASGVLVALKTVTEQTVAGIVIPVELNTPTAAFPAPVGSNNFQDAGTISFDTKPLTKQSNNSYLYNDATNPVSFNNVTWVVSGTSSIPSINYTDNRQIPAFSNISHCPASFQKIAGLTIVFTGFLNDADSVYIQLVSTANGKTVLKRVPGNAVACTFSPSDVSTLDTGSGFLEVCPWNYKIEDFNSKSFYFIMEATYIKSITIN